MVKSYCVKQKKVTLCVPGSETYTVAKNGRLMLKCICSECGITKTKFVKSQKRAGNPAFEAAKIAEKITRKVIPSTDHVFDRYWSGDILKGAFTGNAGITSKKFWTHPDDKCRIKLKKVNGKWQNVYSC